MRKRKNYPGKGDFTHEKIQFERKVKRLKNWQKSTY